MSTPSTVADEVRPFSVLRKLALIVEILGAYCRVRWLLWRRDLSGVVSALRSRGLSTQPVSDETNAYVHGLHLGRAVARTLSLLPADARCLVRSLVLTSMLARRGIGSSLVIGVRTEPTFGAHAWVEHRGEPLLLPGAAIYERLLEM